MAETETLAELEARERATARQPETSNEFARQEDDAEISWTASEFIAHHKTSSWYAKLTLIAVVSAVILYLPTRDEVAAGFILFGAIMFGIYAAREPRQLPYSINPNGLTIGQKYYDFQEFRSFAVVPEGAFSSIVFLPLKRFSQAVTIYYAPEQEDQIMNMLEKSLPYDERHNDVIDNLMRRIRF